MPSHITSLISFILLAAALLTKSSTIDLEVEVL